jgi:ubiquinone/menaquinone biosynthesis C-methylase UbiE
MAAMPFEDDRFDLVFCRFVLVHNQDPTSALQEMMRVTRPGGLVVAYDMVHEGIWFVPERPAFNKLLRRVIKLLRERGSEPNQGLHLAAGMRRAGLADISARVIPHHALSTEELYSAYRDNWVATFESLAGKLGALLDAELVQAALSELKSVSGDEFLVETTVLAWGRKP